MEHHFKLGGLLRFLKGTSDRIHWYTEWTITKFHDPENRISRLLKSGMLLSEAKLLYPEDYKGEVSWRHNTALNEGLQELIDIICGLGAPTTWAHANASLGVGNGETAVDPSQTGLQGASKAYAVADATYPARVNRTAEWRATFGAGVGTFDWHEYTVINGVDDTAKNLNRCVSDKGTKDAGDSWVLSLKITFS